MMTAKETDRAKLIELLQATIRDLMKSFEPKPAPEPTAFDNCLRAFGATRHSEIVVAQHFWNAGKVEAEAAADALYLEAKRDHHAFHKSSVFAHGCLLCRAVKTFEAATGRSDDRPNNESKG